MIRILILILIIYIAYKTYRFFKKLNSRVDGPGKRQRNDCPPNNKMDINPDDIVDVKFTEVKENETKEKQEDEVS